MKENGYDCKIGGRNYNLCHADDNTVITEYSNELQALVIKVKNTMEKMGLKLNIKKTKQKTEVQQLVLDLTIV